MCKVCGGAAGFAAALRSRRSPASNRLSEDDLGGGSQGVDRRDRRIRHLCGAIRS